MDIKKNLLSKFCESVTRHRLVVFLLAIVCIAAFSTGISRMRADVVLQDMFPYDHPYLQLQGKFSKIFGGGGSGVAVAVRAKDGDIFTPETLGRIKTITDDISMWDEVYRSLTVSIASSSSKVVNALSKGEISISALMFPNVPKDSEGIEALKGNIFSSSAYNGTLVSSDGKAALILTEIRDGYSYEHIFEKLRDLSKLYTDDVTEIHVVGYPMLMGWIYSYKGQMYQVFGISLALMVLILFAIFRNFVGMVAPFAMAGICTLLGLGFIGWTGINFSPLLYVLAFLVGARMLSNSVQITHRYIEEFNLHHEKTIATTNTMKAMLMPNVAAVGTDAAGFLIIGLAKIVLLQQLAIIMSFWMATIVLSGLLVPIICSFLPLKAKAIDKELEQENRLSDCLGTIAAFSTRGGSRVLYLGVVAIVVIGVWQMSNLKVGDPAPGSPILWPDHVYNTDQAFINETFDASSENLMLFYEGEKESVYDPEVLNTFQAFSEHMANRLPDIYKSSNSAGDMLRMVNLTFHDGDPVWDQLPRDPTLLVGLMGYVKEKVDRPTLQRYVDKTLERTQTTLFFADHTSDNMKRIKTAALEFFEEHDQKTAHGEFLLAGGAIGLEMALNEEMAGVHAKIDLLVLFAIFCMCSLAFRSVVAGCMLTLPLILSNLVAFSYMAFSGIGLSVNTLPCSAVGVGVGVDFAIYLYSRCREEFALSGDWDAAISEAVRTAGKGIVFTGSTLILPILAWYLISELKFQAQMGFFLAVLLLINMIGALTLHPLLLARVRPKFISEKNNRQANEAAKFTENQQSIAWQTQNKC